MGTGQQRCSRLKPRDGLGLSGTPVADDHGPAVGAVGQGDPIGAGRVKAPLQDGAIDHGNVGPFSVTLALVDWADVGDDGPASHDLG